MHSSSDVSLKIFFKHVFCSYPSPDTDMSLNIEP